MDRSQTTTLSWTLFWTFWAVYVLSAVGTLSMLFFGFGAVRDDERSILVNTFVVESGVAVIALFYALFQLRKGPVSTPDTEEAALRDQLEKNNAELMKIQGAIRKAKAELAEAQSVVGYHDSIVALCSPHASTQVVDILKALLLNPETDKVEVKKVLDEIGRMKKTGKLSTPYGTRTDLVQLT